MRVHRCTGEYTNSKVVLFLLSTSFPKTLLFSFDCVTKVPILRRFAGAKLKWGLYVLTWCDKAWVPPKRHALLRWRALGWREWLQPPHMTQPYTDDKTVAAMSHRSRQDVHVQIQSRSVRHNVVPCALFRAILWGCRRTLNHLWPIERLL